MNMGGQQIPKGGRSTLVIMPQTNAGTFISGGVFNAWPLNMCAEHAMLLCLNMTLRTQQINADVLNVRAGSFSLYLFISLSLSLSLSEEVENNGFYFDEKTRSFRKNVTHTSRYTFP